jgi:uncharacterized protein (TIGR03067 family)
MVRGIFIMLACAILAVAGCNRSGPPAVTDETANPGVCEAKSNAIVTIPDDSSAAADPAIARSPLGSALLREKYRYVKLIHEKRTNNLFLNCKANGIDVVLQIDTGFTCLCIWDRTRESLALATVESPIGIETAGNSVQRSKISRIDELQIGDLPALGAEVLVADHSAIGANAVERGQIDCDGVIGMTWLAAYSCVIDYAHDVLFYREPQPQLDLLPLLPTQDSPGGVDKSSSSDQAPAAADDQIVRSSVIGAVLTRNGYGFASLIRNAKSPDLFVNCAVNGSKICLNVDTGAERTSLSTEVATRLKLSLSDSPEVMFAIGGRHRIQTAPIRELRIGNVNPISVPAMTFVDYSAARLNARKSGFVVYDGRLGAEILSAYSCVIDVANAVLYCLETPQPLIPKESTPPIDLHAILKPFAGTWQAKSIVRDGVSEPDEIVKQLSMTFDGSPSIVFGDSSWDLTFARHSGNQSVDIYLLPRKGGDRGRLLNGIYEFNQAETRLKVCFREDERDSKRPTRSGDGGNSIKVELDESSPNRPTKIESAKGSKTVLIEFERRPGK